MVFGVQIIIFQEGAFFLFIIFFYFLKDYCSYLNFRQSTRLIDQQQSSHHFFISIFPYFLFLWTNTKTHKNITTNQENRLLQSQKLYHPRVYSPQQLAKI